MITNNKRVQIIVLSLLLLFSLGIKLYYVDKYPTYEDEAMSVLAAEGITQHGAPILPSGFLYEGNYLHQYLLSIPIALFGTTDLSTRLPSILFSLLTIVGVYLLVAHLGSAWGGILAGGVLAFSHIEMQYAMSARMYAQYQMFTVFSAYFFLRGFIENSKKYKVLCLIAVLGMLFSHKLALLFIGVIGLYLIFQERLNLLRDRIIWLCVGIIIPALYVTYMYQFPNRMIPKTGHPWRTKPTNVLLTEINYEAIIYYIKYTFSQNFPWSLPIFLAGLVWVIWKKDRRLIFLYLLIAIPYMIMTSFDYRSEHYLFNIFAVYVAVVFIILSRFWKAAGEILQSFSVEDHSSGNVSGTTRNIAGAVLVFIYIVMATTQWKDAYGFKSHFADEKPAHIFVKKNLGPGDVVITSNPWVTYYYLKDFDYFIRQKLYKDRGWDAFPFDRDEYYNSPIIDTLPELQDIMQNPEINRVWVIADGKFLAATGKPMIYFVLKNFRPVYRRNGVTVALYNGNSGAKSQKIE